jgi:hypothetical protein
MMYLNFVNRIIVILGIIVILETCTWNFPGISYSSDLRQTRCARKIPKPVLENAFIKWWSGWVCWLLLQRSWVRIPGKSLSFSVGLALDWQSSLLKNKPCLEWPVCGVGKVIDLLTYMVRPSSTNWEIVVPLVYFFTYYQRKPRII